MVPAVVYGMLDSLKDKHPSLEVSVLVQHVTEAFSFSCPTCGPLNPDAIYLAVAANAAVKMNPQTVPIFAGPNVATLYRGACPNCQGLVADVIFDPGMLGLPS
jgi:hypothetical protein